MKIYFRCVGEARSYSSFLNYKKMNDDELSTYGSKVRDLHSTHPNLSLLRAQTIKFAIDFDIIKLFINYSL